MKACCTTYKSKPRPKGEKVEVAYLFGVSFSSAKRYASMVPSIVNLGQGQPTCTDDEGCAPLPDQSPLQCKTRPMVHLDLRIAETASGAAASPAHGTSSSLG